MAYTRVNWQDLPSTSTPINATNLNKMDAAIKENDDKLTGVKGINNPIYANDFKCKNLYDKNTMFLNKGLWAGSSGISSNTSGWYVVIPITGGLSYTISKKNSGSPFAFIITTTATFPTNGVASVDTTVNAGASSTQYTFSTSSSANYLFLGLAGAGSLTDEQKAQAIEELQVEVGSEKTPYTPYKNFDNTEYVLYDNPSGGNGGSGGTITLKENVENYRLIEVFYGLQYGFAMSSVKTYEPSGKSINLISGAVVQNTNTVYIRTARITFEQTTGTFTHFGRFTWGSVNSVTSDTNEIYIYKVVGYK